MAWLRRRHGDTAKNVDNLEPGPEPDLEPDPDADPEVGDGGRGLAQATGEPPEQALAVEDEVEQDAAHEDDESFDDWPIAAAQAHAWRVRAWREEAELVPCRGHGRPRPSAGTVAQVVALALVLCLLTGAIGWALGRNHQESFNDADAGFLADMSVHHGSAVALGFAYLGRGKDETIGHYAREIIQTQSSEMGVMAILLSDAGTPKIAQDDTVMEWAGHPMEASEMAGLPSIHDLARLNGARGEAADEQFTRLMIAHHKAGIAMAREAARRGENPRVRRMARTMARVQAYEVAEMNRRREALGYKPVIASHDMVHHVVDESGNHAADHGTDVEAGHEQMQR